MNVSKTAGVDLSFSTFRVKCFNSIQTGGGGIDPPLRQNRDNSYTERAMTFKFADFS